MAKRLNKIDAKVRAPSTARSIVDPPRVSPTAVDVKAAWMERIRVYRGRRERDVTVNLFVDRIEREFDDRQRTVGDVIDAWNECAPVSIRTSATIASLFQGTLTLNTMSSSASFEVSRILRDGLERTLVARFPSRIRRVKVRVAGPTAI